MKYTLEVEPSMYFTLNGMGGCVFIGTDDDSIEFEMTWDDLIDRELEMQTIPNQEVDVVTLNSLQELHKLVVAFEDAANKMRERMTSCLVLDRDAWLEANDGVFNHDNRAEFTKPFSHDMVEENE